MQDSYLTAKKKHFHLLKYKIIYVRFMFNVFLTDCYDIKSSLLHVYFVCLKNAEMKSKS